MLRGVAAFAVLLLHLPLAYPEIDTPFSKAYLAVDFFFMLSGFVLTRTYHQRFRTGLSATRFMSLRIRRLWPTIAIGAVFGLISVIGIYAPETLALFFFMNLALVPYLSGSGKAVVFPLNGAVWSILFELVANFFHAKVLAGMSRKWMIALLIAMAVVMITVAAQMNSFEVGAWGGNFIAGFPRVMLSYIMGCLLYLSFGDPARFGVPAFAAPALLTTALITGSHIGGGWRFDAIFVILVCPVVLIAGLGQSASAYRLQRLIGDLSFPLYAVHVPILFMLSRVGFPWYFGPPMAIFGAAITLRLTQAKWRKSKMDPVAEPSARPELNASG